MAYGVILGQTPKQTAENTSYNNSQTSSIITSNNVQGAIDQLFTSVSNGKSLIAEAITDKGVSTASNATFQTMANNINNIPIGLNFTSQNLQNPTAISSEIILGTQYNFLMHSTLKNNKIYYNIMNIEQKYTLNLSMEGNDLYQCSYTYSSIDSNGEYLTIDASSSNNRATIKFYINNRQIQIESLYGSAYNVIALQKI